jgi:hypothetical protein
MSTPNISGESRPRNLTSADLVASAQSSDRHDDAVLDERETGHSKPALAPLFASDTASDFRSRWDIVQRGFVDDPKEAVRAGDELVAQVIKSLAESFASQRATIEGDPEDGASTENLRLALRRYRSFFERLLSI